jgi:hypothetical protein
VTIVGSFSGSESRWLWSLAETGNGLSLETGTVGLVEGSKN